MPTRCSSLTCVDKRDASKKHRPHEDERISRNCVPDVGGASNVLNDVVSVTLHDVVFGVVSISLAERCDVALTEGHNDDGYTNRDRNIDVDILQFLGRGETGGYSFWNEHTSLRVTETVVTEVILYRRRAMHREEAGMPTPAPIRNLVAGRSVSVRWA